MHKKNLGSAIVSLTRLIASRKKEETIKFFHKLLWQHQSLIKPKKFQEKNKQKYI